MKSEKIRTAQRCGVLTVLFDSGIRTGSDIIKAIALGAQAVLRELFLVVCQGYQRLTPNLHTFSGETLRIRLYSWRPSRCRAGHQAHVGGSGYQSIAIRVQEPG